MFSRAKRQMMLIVSVLVLVASFGVSSYAQQNQAGSGLNISPTRTELTIEPGKSATVKLSLRNVSGQDVTAKVIVNDFESDGVTGQPKVIVDTSKVSPNSIRDFLKGIDDIPLAKDEKKDVQFEVQVPANAAPGAYYGVVRYTAVPPGQELSQVNQVSLTASVGSLVLLSVPGNITEQIQVRSLHAKHDKTVGSFFLQAPNKVDIEIKNNGNGFSKPFGRVSVSKGGKDVYSYELNSTDPKGSILPKSVRVFTDDIKNVKTPGRYNIVANISHGQGGEVITYNSSFWYIPAWCLIALLAVLVALAAGGYLVYRKKYGKRRPKQPRRR
jgi:hypothetical protein